MVSPAAPTPWKRIVASIIDFIIAVIPAAIIGGPITLANSNLGSLISAAIVIAIFGTRDAWPIPALQGASAGKKLLGLKAVRSDGSPCDYETSFKRNLPLMVGSVGSLLSAMIGFVSTFLSFLLSIVVFIVAFVVVLIETYKIFTDERGLRIGDLFASSQVVEPGVAHADSGVTHYPPPPMPPNDPVADPPPPPPPPA